MPPDPALRRDLRLRPMLPRDPGEHGRAASTLELFFDLVFVVAVSTAGSELHHALAHGEVGHGLLGYAMVFFAIWWAWMNFTWFATSFDNDDWLYRVITIGQMSGVLVLAAGIPAAFEHGDLRVLVVGYVIMRVALIAQWLRATRRSGRLRRATLRYAAGITAVQVLWVVLLSLHGPARWVLYGILIVAELAVPVIAERTEQTPWNPHHITERYGLFTLIVLGESLLASTNAIIEALGSHEDLGSLIAVSALAFVVTAGLWWIYFYPEHHRVISTFSSSLRYGYGHFLVFAAAGAFSVGIELRIGALSGASHLGPVLTNLSVSLPVAVFIGVVWAIAVRPSAPRAVNVILPLGALAILADAFVPTDFAWTTIIVALLVAALVIWPVVPAAAHSRPNPADAA